MKRSDSIEYHISAHYLSALINSDPTCLTDAESIQLQDFEYQAQQDAPYGFEFGYFSFTTKYSEDYGMCEVSGLHSKVIPVSAIYWKK